METGGEHPAKSRETGISANILTICTAACIRQVEIKAGFLSVCAVLVFSGGKTYEDVLSGDNRTDSAQHCYPDLYNQICITG